MAVETSAVAGGVWENGLIWSVLPLDVVRGDRFLQALKRIGARWEKGPARVRLRCCLLACLLCFSANCARIFTGIAN